MNRQHGDQHEKSHIHKECFHKKKVYTDGETTYRWDAHQAASLLRGRNVDSNILAYSLVVGAVCVEPSSHAILDKDVRGGECDVERREDLTRDH